MNAQGNRFITPALGALPEYAPETGNYRVRLDANESPYLPSAEMRAEMERAARLIEINRYPDPVAAELVSAFAEYYGIGAECCAAGSGSDELISIIISAFAPRGSRMLVVNPDFSMYRFYGAITGAEVMEYQKSVGFEIDFDELSKITRENDINLVIFSNPCNPTGRAYGRRAIEKFVAETSALAVIDEAYMEFARGDYSVMDLCAERDNLIVLKTLSKAFGLAGLRIGFAVSCPELAGVIRRVKSPYNVNSLSQAIGAAVFGFPDEIRANIEKIKRETGLMRRELGELSKSYNFKLYETETNFVLMEFNGGAADEIYSKLKERGIKIRRMNERFLRVSAGTAEQTREFMDNFKEIIKCEKRS